MKFRKIAIADICGRDFYSTRLILSSFWAALSGLSWWLLFLCSRLWCLSISWCVRLLASLFCRLFCLTAAWSSFYGSFPSHFLLSASSNHIFFWDRWLFSRIIVSVRSASYRFQPWEQSCSFIGLVLAISMRHEVLSNQSLRRVLWSYVRLLVVSR